MPATFVPNQTGIIKPPVKKDVKESVEDDQLTLYDPTTVDGPPSGLIKRK